MNGIFYGGEVVLVAVGVEGDRNEGGEEDDADIGADLEDQRKKGGKWEEAFGDE